MHPRGTSADKMRTLSSCIVVTLITDTPQYVTHTHDYNLQITSMTTCSAHFCGASIWYSTQTLALVLPADHHVSVCIVTLTSSLLSVLYRCSCSSPTVLHLVTYLDISHTLCSLSGSLLCVCVLDFWASSNCCHTV